MKGVLLKLNKDLMKNSIQSKSDRVLYKTGAYALKVIKRAIKPRSKKSKGPFPVTIGKQVLLVPRFGKVFNKKTGKPVGKKLADRARAEAFANIPKDPAGPPKRGPMDLLRSLMKFTVDKNKHTLTVGPIVFRKQPELAGVANVPELLEFGGKEKVESKLVPYEKRPFIQPGLKTTHERMLELIKTEQLRP